MVKEYLKKLRDGLVDGVKRVDAMSVAQSEAIKLDKEKMMEYSENIRESTETLIGFMPSSEEVIENLKNIPPIAPFSINENGRIRPVEDILNEENVSRRR